MVKLALSMSIVLLAGTVSAFAPLSRPVSTPTQLHLFGGGNKKEGKKPGIMDQMAMFKKAQEMAKKKQKIDEELGAMDFQGTSEGGKVTASYKFTPTTNPMDPSPGYEATSFAFDEAWYEDASPEDISAACKEAVDNGVETINKAMNEKYMALQGDLMEAFGGGGAAAAPDQAS